MFGIGTGIKVLGFEIGANPIGLAALAIAGFAAVIWKNWEPIKGFFVGMSDGIKTAAGRNVDAHQNNTFNITQQPGQSSKQLADEVARRLNDIQAVKRRGAMFDPALRY